MKVNRPMPAQSASKPQDDLTLMVRLRYPASYFLAITTFETTFPQRQDIIEKFESRWTNPGKHRHQRTFSPGIMETRE